MKLTDAIELVHGRIRKSRTISIAMSAIGIASYAALAATLLLDISAGGALVAAAGIVSIGAFVVHRRSKAQEPARFEAGSLLDEAFAAKDRIRSYVELSATEEGMASAIVPLLERQGEELLSKADEASMPRIAVAREVKLFSLTIPLVWLLIALLYRTSVTPPERRQAGEIRRVIEENRELPPSVALELEKVASILESGSFDDPRLEPAIREAEEAIAHAEAAGGSRELRAAEASDLEAERGSQGSQSAPSGSRDDRKRDNERRSPVPDPTETPEQREKNEKNEEKPKEEDRKKKEEEKKEGAEDEKREPKSEDSSKEEDKEGEESNAGESGGAPAPSDDQEGEGNGGNKSESGSEGEGEGEGDGESSNGKKQGGKGGGQGESKDGQGSEATGEKGSQQGSGGGDGSQQGQSQAPGQGTDSPSSGEQQSGKDQQASNGSKGSESGLAKAKQVLSETSSKASENRGQTGEANQEGGAGQQSGAKLEEQQKDGGGDEQGEKEKGAGNEKRDERSPGKGPGGEAEKTEPEEKRDEGLGGSGKKPSDRKSEREKGKKQEEQSGGKGKGSGKAKQGEPSEESQGDADVDRASTSSLPTGDEDVERYAENGQGEPADSILGEDRQHRDSLVEGKDEKIDSRYLEERGLLDLNTREAKSRLAVQDLKLAKPAPIRERSKQPIPLEYRDELGP